MPFNYCFISCGFSHIFLLLFFLSIRKIGEREKGKGEEPFFLPWCPRLLALRISPPQNSQSLKGFQFMYLPYLPWPGSRSLFLNILLEPVWGNGKNEAKASRVMVIIYIILHKKVYADIRAHSYSPSLLCGPRCGRCGSGRPCWF